MRVIFPLLVCLSTAAACANERPPSPTSSPTTQSASPSPSVGATESPTTAATTPTPTIPAPTPTTTEPAVPVAGEPLGSPVTNAVTTSGGNDVPDSDQVIIALRPKFRACYEAQKKKDGNDIVGMVSCGLHINKEGKVTSVSVTRRDRIPYPMMDCIVGVMKTAKFGPLPDDAMLQVPVRFRVPNQE